MLRPVLLAAVPLALASCAPDAPSGDRGAEPPASPKQRARREAAAEPPAAPPPRAVRYSRLDDCRTVRRSEEEMPFTEVLCAGPAGWSLKIGDSDARQSLAVVAPGGDETRLDTGGIGGGGFSSFGTTAEWRGPAGAGFTPDSLIVRFQVAERPYPAPETSYLLAVRLVPTPCIAEVAAPGAAQNERARAAADAPACEGPSAAG